MSGKCCPACFGDRGLEIRIFPIFERSSGKCFYCDSESDNLVLPSDLRVYFELLTDAYEEDPKGSKTVVERLQEDWLLFDCPELNLPASKLLLADILDDGDIVRKTFKPIEADEFQPVADWETLKDELRYKNRYFLDEEIKADRLSQLLDHLISDPLPSKWYRARIMTGTEVYPIDQMGAPPRETASHGRANPSGIPYLYLASTPRTCIAEVRPHTGEKACVAQFEIPSNLSVVDLRNPRKLVSPFFLEETSEILQLRTDLPFLEKLGNELTRPVLPRSAAIDYVPSQFLCEFIKKQGFAGVLYSSSVSDGMNLALFDVNAAKPNGVSEYSIDRVSVDVSQK